MTNKIEAPEGSEVVKVESFPHQVWNRLSRVDVANHIETAEVKKDGRTVYTYQYLGWAWAWAQLMSIYPESELEILPEVTLPNQTVMVYVTITVRDGLDYLSRTMWLPVMNQANASIENPTTRQISDARMRCIVKCLAMGFGMGLDLWTGSDMPVGTVDDLISASKLELLAGLYGQLNDVGKKGFLAWLEVESISQITEGRYQSARKQLELKLKASGK